MRKILGAIAAALAITAALATTAAAAATTTTTPESLGNNPNSQGRNFGE